MAYKKGNFYHKDGRQHIRDVVFDDSVALKGSGAPSQTTKADFVGQTYVDELTKTPYTCVGIDEEHGLYEWIEAGGGGSPSEGAIKVGTILNDTTTFPTVRPDGSALHDEDWVVFMGTPPKTIGNITFTKIGEKAYYDSPTNTWSLSSGMIVSTVEVLLTDKTKESLAETASTQSQVNEENVTELKRLEQDKVPNTRKVGSSDLVDNITAQELDNDIKNVTNTYTNKTIDADNNTILNLEADNLKAGVLLTAVENEPSDEKWLSEKASVNELNKKVNKTQKVGSSNLNGDIPAQNIQDDIKNLTATLTNKTIDADDNTISNLEVDNFKASAIQEGTADNDKLTTKGYVDDEIDKVVKTTYTFKGYVGTTLPTGDLAEDGDLGYESATMPATFPIQVKTFDGTTWSVTTTDYTPSNLDLWSNLNDSHGYYWFAGEWNILDTSTALVDNVYIERNNQNEITIKEYSITLDRLSNTLQSQLILKVNALPINPTQDDDGKLFLYNDNFYEYNYTNNIFNRKSYAIIDAASLPVTPASDKSIYRILNNDDEYELYYYVRNTSKWYKIGSDEVLVDDETIDLNNEGELQIKDGGVGFNKLDSADISTSISNSSTTIPRTDAVYKELLSNTNSSQAVSYANSKLSLKTTLKNNSNSSVVDKSADILTKVTDYSTLSDNDKLSYLDISAQELKDVALSAVNTYIQSKLTGSVSSVLTSDLTSNRAIIANDNGKLDVSTCTDTELGYVHGVTSSIQGQLNGDLIVEFYPLNQVLDLSVSKFTVNNPSKYQACVIIDRNKTNGACFLNFYADRTESQSSTGWKRVSALLTSWQYKVYNTGTSLSEVSRCLGSMYVSDYVNMVFSIYSDGDIQSYYTQGLVSKTGGINVSLTFPITKR